MGIKLSRKIFSFLFLKTGPIFRSKEIINRNLLIFKKDISNDEINKITSSMWKNYGMTFIEYIFLDLFRKKNSHIIIEGKDYLENIIKNKKPVIFVSGHFANYELMSMEITKKGIPLATIYRPLNNIFLNPLMEYLRRKYICKNQIKKGLNGVREAIDFIKKDMSIALMIDQRVSEGEKINFFGKPALTTTLPAQLSIKYNLPIIPVFIERTLENNFKIKFYKEIFPSDQNNKIVLTEKLNKVLENMIIDNPSEWIWTHNRWK
jgi:KDO2-lipid IV(A) lauroyltransferase|tara:strand:- start:903 stop:1691 length:789 start_codon:yes stop_codon:yes gene_type:complete